MDEFWAQHERTKEYGWEFYKLLRNPGSRTYDPDAPGRQNYEFPWFMFIELSVFLFILSWAYRKLFVSPVARFLLQWAAGNRRKVKDIHVTKFEQAHIEMITYAVFGYFGTIVLFAQPWYWPSIKWWSIPNNKLLAPGEVFFYLLYAARYLQGFVSVMLEPKRKDFYQMQLHHAITVVLIYLSFNSGWVQIGLVIMWLMDLADPPLHFGKQFIYLRNFRGKTPGLFTFSTLSDGAFVVFLLVFLITRNVMYPYVVWSAFYEAVGRGAIEETILQGLLVALLALQFFWAYLLILMLISVLQGKEVNDNRSDASESESEESKKKK